MATRDLTRDGTAETKHGTRGKRAIYFCNEVAAECDTDREAVDEVPL